MSLKVVLDEGSRVVTITTWGVPAGMASWAESVLLPLLNCERKMRRKRKAASMPIMVRGLIDLKYDVLERVLR